MEKKLKDMTDNEIAELREKARQEMIKYKALLKRAQTREERHEMQTRYNAAKAIVDEIKEYYRFGYEMDREFTSALFDD